MFQPFTFSLLLNFDIFWNAYTFIDSHLVRHYNAKEFFIRKKIQPTDWFVSGPSPSSSVINLFIPRVNRRERNRKSINDYMQFIYHSNAYRNPPALSLSASLLFPFCRCYRAFLDVVLLFKNTNKNKHSTQANVLNNKNNQKTSARMYLCMCARACILLVVRTYGIMYTCVFE